MGYDNKNNHKILRVLHLTADWIIPDHLLGLSLKGNTYFRFRRCLDLDSNSRSGDSVILSAVREEQLALLFQHLDT
ncbi:unnamed protein product, partial [Brassica oleracea var. botrytis]